MQILKTIKDRSSGTGYPAFVTALMSILVLTIHNQFIPPLIIIWTLFWIFEFVSRKGTIGEDEKNVRVLFYQFLVFNFIVIAGLFYSDDLKGGSVLLFRRLSLLIFPLVLFSPGEVIRKRVDILLKAFVAGITLFLLICLFYAFWRSLSHGDGGFGFNPHDPAEPWLNYFFWQKLSLDQHPSYTAMYSLLGLFISLEFGLNKTLERRKRVVWIIISIFLLASIYLLSSRASYLIALIIIPVILWMKLKPKKIGIASMVTIFLILILITFAIFTNQRVNNYFDKSVDRTYIKDGRMEIWKSALSVIKRNPVLGVGIGDYYSAMDKEFKKSGFTTGYYKDFNAHNQYLEILCSSGVVGFLVFVSILGMMIFIAIKDRNILFASFVIMMLIFFGFESMLSRLAGNSFFALFSFLLIHYKKNTELTEVRPGV